MASLRSSFAQRNAGCLGAKQASMPTSIANAIRPQRSAAAAVNCAAASSEVDVSLSRRDMMMGVAGVGLIATLPALPAKAEELVQFYGAANPPATPGKIGGVPRSNARYGFKVPESWKEAAINKVEKGTNGTDTRFNGPARKKEQLFVLTLLNYGGTAGFTMDQPPVKLLQSLTGSMPDFQDALDAGELTAKTIEKNGDKYFAYSLEGPDSYLVQVAVKDGRIFGFFVSASAKGFASDRDLLQEMADSFEVYANA